MNDQRRALLQQILTKFTWKFTFFFLSWLTNSSANAACGSIKHNWSPANLIRCSNDWLAQQEQNSCLATNGLCGQSLTRVKSVRTWGRVLLRKASDLHKQFEEIQSKLPFVSRLSGQREKINQNKITVIWQLLPRKRTSLEAIEC